MRIVVGSLALVAAFAVAFIIVDRTEPSWYVRIRYPLEYEHIVRGHAEQYDLDAALLAAVIYRESEFNADARSSSGAIGLMQLLPDTAEGIAQLTGGTQFELDDLYDPEINVRYGSFYLRRLLRKYDDERLALAAYNAGQANVDGWIAEGRDEIPFPETREFVENVLETRELYAQAYADELGLDNDSTPTPTPGTSVSEP
jgi:soluble lytic murein transglycosylase